MSSKKASPKTSKLPDFMENKYWRHYPPELGKMPDFQINEYQYDVKQFFEGLVGELQKLKTHVKDHDLYDTELSLKTNLYIFEDHWKGTEQKIDEVLGKLDAKETKKDG